MKLFFDLDVIILKLDDIGNILSKFHLITINNWNKVRNIWNNLFNSKLVDFKISNQMTDVRMRNWIENSSGKKGPESDDDPFSKE